MACFTHYWTGRTCEMHREVEGEALEHTAGALFRARGLQHGDKIYVVNVSKGVLYLVGRMRVDKIVSQLQAERILGTTDLWKARDHAIAIQGNSTPMRFNRTVPIEVTRDLLFEGGGRYSNLKFESDGVLDRQTLRGVRRLSDSSAPLLERILESA